MNARFRFALWVASLLLVLSLGLSALFEVYQRKQLERVTDYATQDAFWYSVHLTKEYMRLREVATLARTDPTQYPAVRTRYDIVAGRLTSMQNGGLHYVVLDRAEYLSDMATVNQAIVEIDHRWQTGPAPSAAEVDWLLAKLTEIEPALQGAIDQLQWGFSDQLHKNDLLVNRLGNIRLMLAIFQSLLLLGFGGFALTELWRSRRREEELANARADAQAATEAKSRFLANVSHEMRTPLTSVLGYASQALKDPQLQATTRRQISLIERSGEYLASLLGNVLDMSQIEAGRAQLHEETISLATLVDDLRGLFALEASKKGLTFEIVLGPDMPTCVSLDGGKLRQILINLIGNAVKFTTTGGVHVRLDASAAGEENFLLETRVTDTGVGITQAEQDILFSAFEQTASGRSAGGSGLGLAISRDFARLMGGDVCCVNSNAQGSEFLASVLAYRASSPLTEKTAQPAAVSLAGTTILVIEDQAINRELLVDLLGEAGADVIEAENGNSAISALAARNVDTILLDYNLPDCDGLTLARRMRAGGWQGRIVMLSAALRPAQVELNAVNIATWLSKPFEPRELLVTLAGHAAAPLPEQHHALLEQEAARERLGYGQERYLVLASKGLERIESLLNDCTKADHLTRQRLAHSARGVALQIGAQALAHACGQLEVLTEQDADRAPSLLADAQALNRATRAELEATTESPP
ncbi:ATP-binding protein [Andreprevotia chitinilytica]|uniref:ATP-binding protein n=1 Tax=Andreprevotia chitinilytica TaxID=396808 RepID=UPI00068EF45D|nr:ATP-binding protein [Andreprevotia chitinilytica]